MPRAPHLHPYLHMMQAHSLHTGARQRCACIFLVIQKESIRYAERESWYSEVVGMWFLSIPSSIYSWTNYRKDWIYTCSTYFGDGRKICPLWPVHYNYTKVPTPPIHVFTFSLIIGRSSIVSRLGSFCTRFTEIYGRGTEVGRSLSGHFRERISLPMVVGVRGSVLGILLAESSWNKQSRTQRWRYIPPV